MNDSQESDILSANEASINKVSEPNLLNANRYYIKGENDFMEQKFSLEIQLKMISQHIKNLDTWIYNLNHDKECIEKLLLNDIAKSKVEEFRRIFQENGQKAIKYAIKNQLINSNPVEVARLLFITPGLNQKMIGVYLGEYDEFNKNVLKEYVNLFSFDNIGLDEAIRVFLQKFQLPGEAQKIDRMMECFSKKYVEQNQNIPLTSDACYTLSFALIMLNTTLHNANVKTKLSVDEFINMNKNVDNGCNIDPKYISKLYNNIKERQFQFIESYTISEDPIPIVYDGELLMQRLKNKFWKKRYFLIKGNCLIYYSKKNYTNNLPKGIILLANVNVSESTKSKLVIEIKSNNTKEHIRINKILPDKSINEKTIDIVRLQTTSMDSCRMWCCYIENSILLLPGHKNYLKAN